MLHIAIYLIVLIFFILDTFLSLYNINYRFKLKLEVFDGDDSAIFVMKDPQVMELMGVSCETLLANSDAGLYKLSCYVKYWLPL